MIENLITHKKGESSIITMVKKRLKLNLNFVGMFTGKLGSGKTWSGISFLEELDPEFDADKQIIFDFRECMNLINSDWFKAKKRKSILWDEPQISISNRAWQSQMNKLVNYLISTFRHQNIVLIFCAPYKDFLDSQTMKLLHWEFQCSKIDRKKNHCVIYPKYQQYNPYKKKTYPHPLYVIVNHKRKLMRMWRIKKPSKKSIEIYEGNKTDFTTKLNKSIQDALDDMDRVKEIKRRRDKKPLTELQEKILELWKKGMKQKDIAKELKKKAQQISKNEQYMRNKGYYKENYPNNAIKC